MSSYSNDIDGNDVCKSQMRSTREYQNGFMLSIFNQLLVDSEDFKYYVFRSLESGVGQLTNDKAYLLLLSRQLKLAASAATLFSVESG